MAQTVMTLGSKIDAVPAEAVDTQFNISVENGEVSPLVLKLLGNVIQIVSNLQAENKGLKDGMNALS